MAAFAQPPPLLRHTRNVCFFTKQQCRVTSFSRRSTAQPIRRQFSILASAYTDSLVSTLLEEVKNTDRGHAVNDHTKIHSIIEQLAEIGKKRVPRPLADPHIFDNYEVAYTHFKDKNYEPAGGKFRSPFLKSIFRTKNLFQFVLAPNFVVNVVAFMLFGFIPGYVALRGKFAPSNGSDDTVKVFFEPSRLAFDGPLSFVNIKIGRPSSVVLTTTYLDDRVRLGQGGERGSLFVFTRGGAASTVAAEGWRNIFNSDPWGWPQFAGVGFFALWAFGSFRLVLLTALILATVAFILARRSNDVSSRVAA
mmetsp:Transcript_4330/g.6661  ORF Transcript_4330/g.6661 Transcript_4330/m.6661 type:complete len:306 (+) Transcript_4330:42-959(+)|eukprot:CAMPEP_0184646658 /NCGR_PEP_ID=MMETSP0308-20130426/3399_1 /TAXON_ID=38269 /ORGANISM="Gloeochaete witrockiana, Strain SAG 46.84" /LENGTH=305 /DNA_ID=CAMNT_0027076887 /DNA_START=15 /DNA_END=932 /DNA_ORIENTATION=-